VNELVIDMNEMEWISSGAKSVDCNQTLNLCLWCALAIAVKQYTNLLRVTEFITKLFEAC